jgi:hypothetical protein
VNGWQLNHFRSVLALKSSVVYRIAEARKSEDAAGSRAAATLKAAQLGLL